MKDYKVGLSAGGDYIIVKTFVAITNDLRRDYLQAMSALAKKAGLNKYLVDVRGCPYAASILDDYQTAYKIAQDSGVAAGSRIAGLTDPQSKNHAFIDNAANNAGYQVKFFSDEDEAVRWLVN